MKLNKIKTSFSTTRNANVASPDRYVGRSTVGRSCLENNNNDRSQTTPTRQTIRDTWWAKVVAEVIWIIVTTIEGKLYPHGWWLAIFEMPATCVVKGCVNRWCREASCKSFFIIPDDPVRRKEWLIALHRNDLLSATGAKGYHRVCSDHFVTGQ